VKAARQNYNLSVANLDAAIATNVKAQLDVKQSMRPRLLNSHTEAHESLKEEFQS
jgi:hypothetical protein